MAAGPADGELPSPPRDMLLLPYRANRKALEPLIRHAANTLAPAALIARRLPGPAATRTGEGSSLMTVFSDKELDYLAVKRLGRLATIDANGLPHIVPLGWSYNPALDTIDVGGRDFARTKKFRNVQANSKVALVIDDVLPPWRPRCVMVRGQAEALEEATSADGEQLGPIIRIHPGQVISWGLDGAET